MTLSNRKSASTSPGQPGATAPRGALPPTRRYPRRFKNTAIGRAIDTVPLYDWHYFVQRWKAAHGRR
jgi:hypothetical protein